MSPTNTTGYILLLLRLLPDMLGLKLRYCTTVLYEVQKRPPLVKDARTGQCVPHVWTN